MAIKKEDVSITYDSLWFKIFMDSSTMGMYGKEVYISPYLQGDQFKFMQLIGNIGGFARDKDFNKDIDIIVFTDKLMEKFRGGDKIEFIENLEKEINKPNTPYRKLRFVTETLLLDYLFTRANMGEEKDDVMLDQLKAYKASKENIQTELF